MRAFALLRATVVAAAFVSLWTWLIPSWLAGQTLRPRWTIPAVALMALGCAVMVRCVWDFAWTGRGTPAPFDPPRRLVVRGLYRYVRNPMYLGMALLVSGEALALPGLRREMLLMLAAMAVAANLFIVLHEEPALRRQFGTEYERYCRSVRRWIPRLTPFDNVNAPALRSPHLD